MAEPILVAQSSRPIYLLPRLANRHGLIAGATGTGKTVTLQSLAEGFSARGVAVFMADVKGDLAGLSQAGASNPKIVERAKELNISDFKGEATPVVFWDVFGEQGHPVRATVSEMGPLLFSRLLNLNDTQSGVLTLVFKIADDNGLLLLDLKDLQAMLQHVGDHTRDFQTQYGNISIASIGAIQRGLVGLQQQGADRFFGEPALNLDDLLQTDSKGQGVVNILAANKLLVSPTLYATLLLWLLSELFEQLPATVNANRNVAIQRCITAPFSTGIVATFAYGPSIVKVVIRSLLWLSVSSAATHRETIIVVVDRVRLSGRGIVLSFLEE